MTSQKDPEGTETRRLHQAIDFTGRGVLEIGCGDGRLTWRYAHSCRSVIGIDVDTGVLKAAQAGCPGELQSIVKLTCASALNLPFPNATFEAAILAWSF
jgi:ubiquinone/menaquinone biosynthesis C-methylase UbiE